MSIRCGIYTLAIARKIDIYGGLWRTLASDLRVSAGLLEHTKYQPTGLV